MNVLCIGETRVDTVMFVDGFIKENTKNAIKEKISSPSGCAFLSSVLLSKWGHNTYLISTIGRDEDGLLISKYLTQNEVNTDYLVRNSDETKKSLIIINKYNLSRTILNNVYKSESIKKSINVIPDIILMDGNNYKDASSICTEYPTAKKIIKASSVNEEVMKLCKVSDYIICDKEFAEITSRQRINYDKPDSLKSVINKLESMYNSRVIITLGNKGTLYKIDDKIKVMGSIKVKEVDNSGVGDIYFGAFAYGMCEGLELEKCLKIATIAAGLSVKKRGEIYSIPDVREVHKIYGKNK